MKRVTAYALLALALSLCLAGPTGCVNPAWSPTEPTITSFTANPTAVTAGGTASLTGVFANGTGVITPGNIVATSGTAVSVTPTQTTTYILTVTNASWGTSAQAATVTVTPAAPTIASFTATPAAVTAGGTASLTGVFANGTGVITPGNLPAASGTAVSVTPTDTMTYTLTVTNSAGATITQTATVTVNPVVPVAPTITSFAASPASIAAGGTASLTGVFANGTGVITPGNIAATSGTAVSVTPSDTTTYTLTVTNSAGVITQQTATVAVNPVVVVAPTITSFTAAPTSITAGGTASLTGVFSGGTGVITPGNIAVTSGTAVTVTPSDTTTYTLTVTNSAGVTVAQTVTVTVNVAAPTITSFTANPATITAGGTSSLTGVFSGGKGVITPGSIAATSGTAVSVTPTDTTIYTLTVTNSAGVITTQTVTVTVTAASAPAAPTGLTAAAGNASVTLSWTASTGATSYNIYRGTTSGGESTTPIATGVTTPGYTDSGLTNGQEYYYKVAAVNNAGASPMSNEASATPTASACAVALVATDTGVAEIDLSWNACPGATSYYILRSTASGGPYTTLTVSTGTAYQDFGLVSMQTYYYLVRSVNSADMNVESNEANAVFTSKYVSQDANGWTTVIPSPNGKQYYVSSSTGSDSNPGTQAKPFATIKKAAKLVRPGYPDWILLRAGDVWYDDFGDFQPIGGLSADEPMVFTSYGTGPRPQMRFTNGGDNVCFGHYSGHTFSHFYFIGLECYDSRKDPSSPDYESSNGKATASDTTAWGEVDNGDDILVEDNYFHFTAGGIVVELDTGPAPKNVRIRRNVITDQYAASGAHSQGAFLANITNLLVEDNLFDHNAWNDQAGIPAGVFNHHMYVVDSYMKTIRNNLMLRDESLSLKLCSYAGLNDAFAGALVYNNLIFEGEVGISMGYGASAVLTGSAFTGFKVDNNILLQVDRDNPTGRGLGWGIDIQNVSESYFTNNIFSQFDTLPGGNTYAFYEDRNPKGSINYVASGIAIQNNLIYQDAGEAFILDASPTFTNIKIQNNTIQNTGLPTQSQVNYDPLMYLETDNSLAPYSFSGNTYYNAGPYNGNNSNNGFAFVDTGNILDTYNQWLTRSGETGSQIKQIAYPDPNRTLESYDVTLGGASSLNPIFAAIRSQSRASWNPAYTAEAVNDYIRNGFSVAPLGGGVGNTVAAPAFVTTLQAAGGNASVTLTWTVPSGSPTFYIVYRGTSAGGENVVSPVATYVTGSPWTDTTAVNGQIYYYQVASMNAGGFGGLSNEVSATPQASSSLLTPNVSVIPTFSRLSTGSSLSVQVTVSGSGATPTGTVTLSGGSYTSVQETLVSSSYTFTIPANSLTAGTDTLTVSYSGDSNYLAATGSSSVTVTPAAPTGLTATAGNGTVALSWTAISGATSYNIYRGTTSGGESATPIATGITTTGYTDTGLTNGQEYYYEVTAVNSAGISPMSNEASATPSGSAVTPTTPVPPAVYVMPGRTYDPNEPLSPPTGSGTQYYVALTGNDSNPGTAALPFRTVQRGFNALTNGGDTLIIHGGLYRERVSEMSKDAPDGNPFIIRPFGDGEVIVDGSTLVAGWTAQGGNIYMAHTGFDVAAVVVDNQPLYKELSVAGLQAAPTVADVPADYRFYFDSTAQNLYVRVAGGDPGTHDTGVITADNTQDGIYLWECSNYVLYGLSERFAGGRGINFQGSNNITVEWSKVVFNGYHGLVVGAEEGYGSNAQFIKNFVYFNFMENWPRSWVWGDWGQGISFQATPTGLADGNISIMNGGEGIGNFDNLTGGTIFRNNVSADNWSLDYYMDNAPNGLIEGNLAVGHAPDPANWYNSGILPSDPSGDYFKVVELSRSAGIGTGDEDYGIGANLNNTTIRNNVIINARDGTVYGAEGDAIANGGLKNFRFVNNTVLVPTPSSVEVGQGINIVGINIPYNNGNNIAAYYENNIIMGGNTGTYAMAGGAFDTQTVPAANLFLGLTIDHNLIYTPSNTTPFIWNGGDWGTAYTHAQWLALTGGPGHGAGDVLTDPDLMNPNTDGALDKIPLPGSPAIDAGASIPAFVTTDFLGFSRPQGAGYDIGAFEVAAGPSAPTGLTATAGNASVSLSWTASAGATSYNVYRGTSSGGESTAPIATGITTTTYSDTGLTNGTPYFYEVAAVNSAGTGPLSNEASATPEGAAPAAPTGLTATAGSASVSLSWTASTGATTYNVYRGTTSGGESATPVATGVTTTSYADSGLTNGQEYYYEVAALNGAGTGPMSNEVSATPVAASGTGITIPTTHPRLWWNAARLAQAKAWFAANPNVPKPTDNTSADYYIDIAWRHVVAGADCIPAITFVMNEEVPAAEFLPSGNGSDYARWYGEAAFVVYDWCYDQMTAQQRADFLDNIGGSGAGWNDYLTGINQQAWGGPSMVESNYNIGNMRNDIESGIGTYWENLTAAEGFLTDGITTRWTDNFVPSVSTDTAGGVDQEGNEYAESMMQYPIIPFVTMSLDGRDIYNETEYFKEQAYWVIYETTPAPTPDVPAGTPPAYQLNPFSDDEHFVDGGVLVTGSDTQSFMNMASNYWSALDVGKYTRQWVNTVAADPATFVTPNYILAQDAQPQSKPYTSLPLDYYATAIQYLYGRKAWDTSSSYFMWQLGIAPTPVGHQHIDIGNFNLWRGGRWLSRETTGYDDVITGYGYKNYASDDTEGILAHNGIVFGTSLSPAVGYASLGLMPSDNQGQTTVRRLDSQPGYVYADVDLTPQYLWPSPDYTQYNTGAVVHVERELLFLRDLETTLVFDRLTTGNVTVGSDAGLSAANEVNTFDIHFETNPTLEDAAHLTATNGAQALRLTTLVPAAPTRRVINEQSCSGCSTGVGQYRVELDTSGNAQRYFLNVLQGRDATADNIVASVVDSAPSSPTTGTFTVTLQPSVGATTTVVFNKGQTSSGGTVNLAGAGVTTLRAGVQTIRYTDSGPVWGQ